MDVLGDRRKRDGKWCEEEKIPRVVDARSGKRDLSAEPHRLIDALSVQESGEELLISMGGLYA